MDDKDRIRRVEDLLPPEAEDHIRTTSSKPTIAVYRQGEQPNPAKVDHRHSNFISDRLWRAEPGEKPVTDVNIDQLAQRMESLEKKLAALVEVLTEQKE